MVHSSTRSTEQHARLGFKPQMDRSAIRRTDYPAMGGNQLVTQSQAPQVVQAGWDDQN